MSKDKVYISGAITGVPRDFYLERFSTAEQLLKQKGYRRVVNPTRVWACRWPWLYKVVGYRLTLFYDLWLLMRCQRIYRMPGWQQSHGANIESCMAYHLNIYPLAKPVRDAMDKEVEKLIKQQERRAEQ